MLGRRAVLIIAAVGGTLAAILSAGATGSVAATSSAPSPGYTASQIPIPGATSTPNFVAVNSTTSTVYAASGSAITVIDSTTGSVTVTINLSANIGGIAVDNITNRLYVTLGYPASVAVIDGATNTVVSTISLPAGAGTGVAVDSSTNTVYVANPAAADVIVIDGATDTIKATIGTGLGTRPAGVAVDESTHVVWVADQSGSLIAINGSSDSITEGIGLGGSYLVSVAVNAGTDTVYATDARNGDVVVVDGSAGTITTLIPVGAGVAGIAVDQGSGVVYASALAGGTTGITWIIDGAANHVTDTVGRGGSSVALNQATGSLYEAPYRYRAVWVVTSSAANAWSPVITSNYLAPVFVAGATNKLTLVASALPVATFSETGTLPAGVTLSANGVLSGTPAASDVGSYPITVTASNGVAPDSAEQLTLTVGQLPAVTSASSDTFRVGSAGSFALTATGYPPPSFRWSGGLPGGVSVLQTASGWQLSGTPVVGSGGVYPFSLIAYNSAGSATQAFTLTVQEAPNFIGSKQATFTTGNPASFVVPADGYPAPTFSETGKLPADIAIAANGSITGTPASGSGGTYPIMITASNGIGSAAKEAFAIIVHQPPAFTSARSATFPDGYWHSFTIRSSGYPAARLSEHGTLPAGVTFKARANGTAVMSGTAPRADEGRRYAITVYAKNGVGQTIHETFTLTVG